MDSAPMVQRAVAYLKQTIPVAGASTEPTVQLTPLDSPVVQPFVEGLCVTYVVDAGTRYDFIQGRHLAEAHVEPPELHRIGLGNLQRLVSARETRVHPHGNIFAVLMGGDFEGSLILLDALWDGPFRRFVKGDYAAAVPARDMLAFCDDGSAVGIRELRAVIDRVFPKGDHLLSNRLYVRRGGKWEPRMDA